MNQAGRSQSPLATQLGVYELPTTTNGAFWRSQTFQGREGITVTIISAYQVVTDTPGKGLTTAASQHSLLIQAQDTITAPRVAFRRDLQTYIHQCRGEGQEILLIGDFNKHIGIDR